MGVCIGVDEAGRGPVLGSMFVAGVAVPTPRVLPEGVADSKTLAPATRAHLAEEIATNGAIDTAIFEVTPAQIDNAASLTALTAKTTARVIETLACEGWDAIVDTGEADTGRYETRVRDQLEIAGPVTAAIGADAQYSIVAAASIIAKQAREIHIEHLQAEHGAIGSGYPSDPQTREYLTKFVDDTGTLPPFARKSWSTCADIIAEGEQHTFDSY